MQLKTQHNVSTADVENTLRTGLLSGIRLKSNGQQASLQSTWWTGCTVSVKKDGTETTITVTPTIPGAAALNILFLIVASAIYQLYGWAYGIPAICVAVGWQVPLAHVTSRRFAERVLDILRNAYDTPSRSPFEQTVTI